MEGGVMEGGGTAVTHCVALTHCTVMLYCFTALTALTHSFTAPLCCTVCRTCSSSTAT